MKNNFIELSQIKIFSIILSLKTLLSEILFVEIIGAIGRSQNSTDYYFSSHRKRDLDSSNPSKRNENVFYGCQMFC